MLFVASQRDAKYLGYFCREICHQDHSKIAQSGHAGWQCNQFLGHQSFASFLNPLIARTEPVWPDVGMKSPPNLSKSCPKSRHSCVTLIVPFFTMAQRVSQIFWLFFVLEKFVAKICQNEPNLVTLNGTKTLRYRSFSLSCVQVWPDVGEKYPKLFLKFPQIHIATSDITYKSSFSK